MVLVLSIAWMSQAMQQEQAEQERILRKNSMLLHARTQNDFQQMLDAGADINGQTLDRCSVLCSAIDQDKEHVVQMLLNARANVNIQNGGIPLHRAIFNNNIVQMLLDAGADVNVQNKWGKTALLAAIYHDRHDVVRQLIDRGADVNLQDDFGHTALGLSLLKERPYLAYYDDTYEDIFDMLINAEADVNYTDRNGITPLYSAVCSQSEYRAFRLLAAGADVNHRYNDGMTILIVAACNKNTSLVKLLLNWNDIIADWRNNNEDIDDLIPLHIKTVQDTLDIIQENRFNLDTYTLRQYLAMKPLSQEYIDKRNAEQAAVDLIDIATHARIAQDIPEVIMSQIYEYLAPRSNIVTKHQVENSINSFRQHRRNRMQNPSSAAFDTDAAVL